ncbi:MAG: response regulator [Pirellulales bacterium]
MNNRRFLVVDDNAEFANALAALIRSRGYECDAANSGREALAIISDQDPVVILTDLSMPGIDGADLCNLIRKLPGGESKLVFGVTGWPMEAVRDHIGKTTFDQVMRKPIGDDMLTAIFRYVGAPDQITASTST